MSLFLMRPTTENYEITNERKFWIYKILMRKNLGPAKYHMKKNFEPTKYPREKVLDPRNTHEDTMARRHYTHYSTQPSKFSAPAKDGCVFHNIPPNRNKINIAKRFELIFQNIMKGI